MKRMKLFALAVLIPTIAMSAPQHHSLGSGNEMVSPAWFTLRKNMEKMHAAMGTVTPSRNSDMDFVRLMLPHHQAAIDMTKTELMYGNDPQMRRLAQEILTDQQSEIELMQLWLKQRAALSDKPGRAADTR